MPEPTREIHHTIPKVPIAGKGKFSSAWSTRPVPHGVDVVLQIRTIDEVDTYMVAYTALSCLVQHGCNRELVEEALAEVLDDYDSGEIVDVELPK